MCLGLLSVAVSIREVSEDGGRRREGVKVWAWLLLVELEFAKR